MSAQAHNNEIPPAPPMQTRAIGPVHCAWWRYRRGETAEPRVRAWLAQAHAADTPLVRDTHGRPRFDAINSAPHDADSAAMLAHDTNWSHSGELLVAAYARDAEVGVDVEWLRPRPKALALAERFFAGDEIEALRALPPAQQQLAFTRLWCAKEAVLKAHGRGLSFGLERLRFALENTDAAQSAAPRLIACDPDLGTPTEWRLQAWAPEPGYLATLAYRKRAAHALQHR